MCASAQRRKTRAENDKTFEEEETFVVRRRTLLRRRIPQHRGRTDAENDKTCFGARVASPHIRHSKQRRWGWKEGGCVGGLLMGGLGSAGVW